MNFDFNADPDPAFHFNADPGPAPHQKWWESANTGLQTLQGSILNLQASIVSVHGSRAYKELLNLDFDADPDPAFHLNPDPDPVP